MPLNDIWNTWAESGNDTEKPTHRIGNNRLLTLIICNWGIHTWTQRKILRHKDDEELPHNIQVPKFWVTNFKKKMYQLPYSSNLNAEVVFFFLNLIDFKLHTESMQLQLHEKKNFIQYITE